MNRWFRVYDGLVDDPKVQRLPPILFKAIINLWCLASQNNGHLPSNETMEFKLRLSSSKLEALIDGLTEAGLLDGDQGALRPHNWDNRQFRSDVSTDRVKRFRNKKRNGDIAVSETPPETETETETENRIRDQNKIKKDAAIAAPEFRKPESNLSQSIASPQETSATPQLAGDEKSQFYARARAVLGVSAGGLATKLLNAKEGIVPLARAALETASTKGPAAREYIGAIIRSAGAPIEQQHDPRL